MIRVGVVGAGYWGPNLIRNFAVCPRTRLAAICDSDPARRAEFRERHGIPGSDVGLELSGVVAVVERDRIAVGYS